MANCLETVREWDIALFSFFFIGKPLEYFLILAIFIVQLNLFLLNSCFLSFVLRDIIFLKSLIDKNGLLVWVFRENSLETMWLMFYLGISRTFPIFLRCLWKKLVSLLAVLSPLTFLISLKERIFSLIYKLVNIYYI